MENIFSIIYFKNFIILYFKSLQIIYVMLMIVWQYIVWN